MRTQDYNFKVTAIESGQRNRYGDSYFHFKIENWSEIDYHENVIKNFCTKFLRPASMSEAEWKQRKKDNPDDFGLNFAPHYTSFKKIDDRTFEYKVTEPSTH